MSLLQSASWSLGMLSLLIAGHSPLRFVHLAAESAQRGTGGRHGSGDVPVPLLQYRTLCAKAATQAKVIGLVGDFPVTVAELLL